MDGWTLGAPGRPRSLASAVGEAANANTEMPVSASARTLRLCFLLLQSVLIPLPLRAVVNAETVRSVGFANALLITRWGDGRQVPPFE